MTSNKSIMLALGGNALSPKDQTGTIKEQFERTRQSLNGIMEFIKIKNNICITHGNGPQVGNELLRMDLTHEEVPPLPLGLCVAATQGTIGYMIQQSLQNKLRTFKIDREVVTLVTQVRIDEQDPAISDPTKFVGKTYSEQTAKSYANKLGWDIAEQNPGEWRRVVPSPLPHYVMHGKSIKALVDRGTIVLAAGGGGIPVFNDKNYRLKGIDAVIDKDLTAAKLGRVIRAQELWIITDIDYVYLRFKKEGQKAISQMTTLEAEQYLHDGEFKKGSMAPKIRAALYFLKHYGEKVIITSIPSITDAIHGKAGTRIIKSEIG
ncbi:carbamate kinase [bacterium]|nr:MAG: carbamate kinase [bacterium]|tara:strand:- start:7662 stop:8621 length:960 start_codon:yes stop_codon:yes gene_type:complete